MSKTELFMNFKRYRSFSPQIEPDVNTLIKTYMQDTPVSTFTNMFDLIDTL